MITHPAYTVEPWCLRETGLHLDLLAQSESLFALGNGHMGWRGNLDEGDPHGVPGSYLAGVYESRPLPYAEIGFGYPEAGQTVVNVTNGKPIRLLVNDHPFDVRYGELRSHERVLDFRSGLLSRSVEWVSPGGQAIAVRSTRLVSLVQRSMAAIHFEIESLGSTISVVLQSELVANEIGSSAFAPDAGDDPRSTADIGSVLVGEQHEHHDLRAYLLHSTAVSGLRVVAAMDHAVDAPDGVRTITETSPDLARVSVMVTLAPGQRLRLVKYVAHGWSGVRSRPALRDQAAAALSAAVHSGWDGLVSEQRAYLDDFWARADVEVDGDEAVQQAVRFGQFHILQAASRAEGRAIAAKGLTGPGYDGHAFWDTEIFVLPLLSHACPAAAVDALRWRRSILPLALERASQLGLAGAAFPWRTIAGHECSGYWPAGTAAFHVGADVAAAAIRHVDATGDLVFERDVALELLVQTARLWCSLGHHDTQGQFRIDGVTGPDEYSAVADNNVYTNLMAQQNLAAAAELALKYPVQAGRLRVTAPEIAAWRGAATAMYVPWDEALGVHPQADGFTHHQVWDFAATAPEQYPLLLHFHYFDLYRKQVVKQADLVLAMYLRPEAFTAEQKARNFAYYEAITVRDSSLSACVQSVLAAETGHIELAHDYLGEAALLDLNDLEHNTRSGLHLAALAGTWIALVPGLGGLREHGTVSFSPRLPERLTRLAINLAVRGRLLRVEITHEQTLYRLVKGEPLEVSHDGTIIQLNVAEPVRCPTSQPATITTLHQPAGRAPTRRGRDAP
ncbi:glycoside hydrolase family 65 protein [Tessaracoccus antarcticus]|uniref:Glycoside hydrolase family 65 protein n=1 Tax=Tessaracoccus antarcticus TaxID=2479848 RepID=A0A3M0GGP0_9ACTN|nr:glycosyl hydrolase family 65 protein [Tessaracoccus antarcticus]RMB60309.1 glycoside hydrolase family 65 protein [Tessaracoccus antarcticus]